MLFYVLEVYPYPANAATALLQKPPNEGPLLDRHAPQSMNCIGKLKNPADHSFTLRAYF